MLKRGLVEWLREREKGVFTTGHPRNPFQVSTPPPGIQAVEGSVKNRKQINKMFPFI